MPHNLDSDRLLASLWIASFGYTRRVRGQFEAASFFKQGSTDERTTFVNIPPAHSLYILWFPGENASFGPYFAFYSSWEDLHSWHSYAGALVSYYREDIVSREYIWRDSSAAYSLTETGKIYLREPDWDSSSDAENRLYGTSKSITRGG